MRSKYATFHFILIQEKIKTYFKRVQNLLKVDKRQLLQIRLNISKENKHYFKVEQSFQSGKKYRFKVEQALFQCKAINYIFSEQ